MKKLFTFFLALVVSVGTMFAESGTCGTNLTWNLTNGVLKISGTGAMADFYCDWCSSICIAPWYSYRSLITKVSIGNGVTSIGEAAFYYCSGLTSVTIPNSVTSIGEYAFSGCSGLTSVTIPNSVTSIGEGAFSGCKGLTSVTIPNSVTRIGRSAFSGCSELTSISVESGNTTYDSRNNCNAIIKTASNTLIAGCKNTSIPNSVTSIGEYAFSGCTGLTSVEIPNSVTSIGEGAFRNCTGLFSVTIPNSVTSIGYEAFSWCSGLTNVTIPNSVTSIGKEAFYKCSSLASVIWNAEKCSSPSSSSYAPFYNSSQITSVIFGEDVKVIPAYLCYGMSNLKEITIPNSVTSIGSDAFSGCTGLASVIWNAENCSSPSESSHAPFYYIRSYITSFIFGEEVKSIPAYLCYGMSNLKEITISNSVTSIGRSAFSGCSGLTSVTIPNSVTSIGDYAFYWCSGLTSVTIPNSVTSIGEGAFSGCSGLTSPVYTVHVFTYMPNSYIGAYTIPDGIESIAGGAFYECTSLTSVTIPNSVTSIGRSAFSGCSGLTSVTIPNSVTSIGDYAFYWCSGLTSVTIPNSVTSIGEGAFSGCSGLTYVTIEATTPPYVSENSFPSNIVICVPFGYVSKYIKSTYWKNYNIQVKDLYPYITLNSTSINITFGEAQNILSSCGIEGGEQQAGNILEYIGLEPESEYKDVPIVLTSNTGEIETVNISFTTYELELATQESKPVSSNTAILLAETNMADIETSCGFEWKRNDAPEDMTPSKVLCPVANGQMAGRLKNLKDEVYYKYRAFYQSAAGNMFYGDWKYIFTGDVAVEFDPILYTYAAMAVKENEATLKGYALAGSEDFTEQGFEYWAESRANNAPRRTAASIGDHKTVTASGISLRTTLTDLDEGTVYKYRTYAKIGDKTLYGSEMAFTTQGEYQEGQAIEDIHIDVPQATKILHNGQIYILRGEKIYTITGQKVR